MGAISNRGLNSSLPCCIHPGPIKLVFYESPNWPLFEDGFALRCFQSLSVTRVAARRCLIRQPVHQMRGQCVPFVLKLPSSQATALPVDCIPTVSRTYTQILCIRIGVDYTFTLFLQQGIGVLAPQFLAELSDYAS